MIKKIEQLSMNAWPGLQHIFYDGWILRFANGYAKRANSVNPIYYSTDDVDKKIQNSEKFFYSKGITPVFKMTPSVYPENLDGLLSEKGYKTADYTSIQILNLDTIQEPALKTVTVYNTLTEDWLQYFCTFAKVNKANIPTLKQMLQSIVPERYFVLLKVHNEIIGCAMGVIEDEYIGLYEVVIAENYRNKGYGKELILNMLNLGKSKGAKNAYLQVVVANTPAVKLYSNIGFKEVYQYWYRIKAN